MKFVDEVVIRVASGAGGDGSVSFHREKYMPRGGPDGGDGGRGGAVIFEASRQRNTLVDFRWNKRYAAFDGGPGRPNQDGSDGEDIVIWVPIGTELSDEDSGEVLADLSVDGARHVVPGGSGGLGNLHFKSSTNRTPLQFEPGGKRIELQLRLELKLLADVGLLGFPNAGKSTLISRISAAKPKIADYPFTTLVPNLGVVRVDDGKSFVVADIPGLIEGASQGAGLGIQFLKHVERCGLLLHLVAPDQDGTCLERLRVLDGELAAYSEELASRPQIVVLTKSELLSEDEREAVLAELATAGRPVLCISAVTGDGLQPLLWKTWDSLQSARSAVAAVEDRD